jgi:hypothetical protein
MLYSPLKNTFRKIKKNQPKQKPHQKSPFPNLKQLQDQCPYRAKKF